MELFDTIKNTINTYTSINDCNRATLDFHMSMNAVNNATSSMLKDDFSKQFKALKKRT